MLAPFSSREGQGTTAESLLTFLPSPCETREKIKNKSLWKWAFEFRHTIGYVTRKNK